MYFSKFSFAQIRAFYFSNNITGRQRTMNLAKELHYAQTLPHCCASCYHPCLRNLILFFHGTFASLRAGQTEICRKILSDFTDFCGLLLSLSVCLLDSEEGWVLNCAKVLAEGLWQHTVNKLWGSSGVSHSLCSLSMMHPRHWVRKQDSFVLIRTAVMCGERWW